MPPPRPGNRRTIPDCRSNRRRPTVLPGLTGIILPTPTIFTYTVVQGDTLSSIALHARGHTGGFAVGQPGHLAGGTLGWDQAGHSNRQSGPRRANTHSRPSPGQAGALLAGKQPADCGALPWCRMTTQKRSKTFRHSSPCWIRDGQELATQVVYGLLDILPPAHPCRWQPTSPRRCEPDASLRVQVLTAIRLLPGDTRYLPVRLENTLVSVDASGRTAEAARPGGADRYGHGEHAVGPGERLRCRRERGRGAPLGV